MVAEAQTPVTAAQRQVERQPSTYYTEVKQYLCRAGCCAKGKFMLLLLLSNLTSTLCC